MLVVGKHEYFVVCKQYSVSKVCLVCFGWNSSFEHCTKHIVLSQPAVEVKAVKLANSISVVKLCVIT